MLLKEKNIFIVIYNIKFSYFSNKFYLTKKLSNYKF